MYVLVYVSVLFWLSLTFASFDHLKTSFGTEVHLYNDWVRTISRSLVKGKVTGAKSICVQLADGLLRLRGKLVIVISTVR